jgi:hypothetical protein
MQRHPTACRPNRLRRTSLVLECASAGAERRQTVAHSVSCGSVFPLAHKPRRGGRILQHHLGSRVLSPLWGSTFLRTEPTAHAVGYHLPVLRTSPLATNETQRPNGLLSPSPGLARQRLPWGCSPSRKGAERRQIVAHSVSCGSVFPLAHKPRRGGRILRFPASGLLSPLRGSSFLRTKPTAHAVGYGLPVLRTYGMSLRRSARSSSPHRSPFCSAPSDQPFSFPCPAPTPNF